MRTPGIWSCSLEAFKSWVTLPRDAEGSAHETGLPVAPPRGRDPKSEGGVPTPASIGWGERCHLEQGPWTLLAVDAYGAEVSTGCRAASCADSCTNIATTLPVRTLTSAWRAAIVKGNHAGEGLLLPSALAGGA